MKYNYKVSLLGTMAITIFGIIKGQVTVFYIIYLFWFQELIRTIIDMIYQPALSNNTPATQNKMRSQGGSLFLLFIYFVFIVVLFCFILNWEQDNLLVKNIKVLFFRNIYFNCTLIFFALSFFYQRKMNANNNTITSVFNPRHIILHISIILGGIIQFFVVRKYNIDSLWGSAAVIAPFLLLQLFFELRFENAGTSTEPV